MKTTISIIVCLLFFSSKACDMCGGVSGNASIGLFAANQFHYLVVVIISIGKIKKQKSFTMRALGHTFNVKYSISLT